MAITPNRTLPNDWDSALTYHEGDLVTYINIIYRATKAENNINKNPFFEKDYWTPLEIYIKDATVMDHGQYSGDENFWERDNIYIDGAGWVYINGENTGINVTGPPSTQVIDFEDLTPAQKEQIKGEKGDPGPIGPQGETGPQGPPGEVILSDEQIQVLKGDEGKSAYDIWLENGHSGSEADFLVWLQEGIITLDDTLDENSLNGVQNKVVAEAIHNYQRKTDEIILQLEDRIKDLENRLKFQYNQQYEEFKFGITNDGQYGYIKQGTDTVIPFNSETDVISSMFTMQTTGFVQNEIGQSSLSPVYESIAPTQLDIEPTSLEGTASNDTGEDVVLFSNNVIAATAEESIEPTYEVYTDGQVKNIKVGFELYNMQEDNDCLSSIPDTENPDGTIKGTGIWFTVDSASSYASRLFVEIESVISDDAESPYDEVQLYYRNNITQNEIDAISDKALVLPTIINSATQSIILDKNETTVFRIEINQNRGVCIGAKSATGNFKITKIYMK